MIDKESISSPEFVSWVVCLVIFVLLIYILLPKIKDLFNKARYGADLVDMVKDHEEKINGKGGMIDKLDRDYNRINALEQRQMVDNKESELVMRALLAILQSIGDNPDTKQVENEIIRFMNEQSHQ